MGHQSRLTSCACAILAMAARAEAVAKNFIVVAVRRSDREKNQRITQGLEVGERDGEKAKRRERRGRSLSIQFIELSLAATHEKDQITSHHITLLGSNDDSD